MRRRADVAKERWITRALTAARRYRAEGDADAEAADLAMRYVDTEAAVGRGGGIGEMTRRAAHREWAAWTAEVARRLASARPRTVPVASARIV